MELANPILHVTSVVASCYQQSSPRRSRKTTQRSLHGRSRNNRTLKSSSCQSSKLLAPPFIRFLTRLVHTNLITRASL